MVFRPSVQPILHKYFSDFVVVFFFFILLYFLSFIWIMKRGEKYKFIIEKHLALTQFLLALHCHIFNIISWNVDVVACLLNVIFRSKAIESNVNDKCKRVATIINLLNFLPHKRFPFYLNNFDAISLFFLSFVLLLNFFLFCF